MNTFHHVSAIGQKNAVASLEDNLKGFLDWSFLNIGGFINVNAPTSGLQGSNFHTLKPVTEPSQKIKVWEAPRKDWVYETGILYDSASPISISGVTLNGTFLPAPTGSGSYGYNINYPLGRIEFINNVAPNSNVSINYSYRYVQTYKANDSYWWKELQSDAYNPANFKASGDYSITANHRIQLPAIIIETTARTVLTPRELGTSQNIILQDILLHVFSHNIQQRNTLTETLLLQKDKSLSLYNINDVVEDSKYPLNKNGSIHTSGLSYPDICDRYRQNWCNIKNSTVTELNQLTTSLYNGVVRWSVEIFP
jgi:hypothetical protein